MNGTEARGEEPALALALSVSVTVISAIGLLLNGYILFIIVLTKQARPRTSQLSFQFLENQFLQFDPSRTFTQRLARGFLDGLRARDTKARGPCERERGVVSRHFFAFALRGVPRGEGTPYMYHHLDRLEFSCELRRNYYNWVSAESIPQWRDRCTGANSHSLQLQPGRDLPSVL
ncbi:hypothetical protein EVAR_17033_1 [Eumeta japonica]|uniref:Uncharacterized protein n=1 Tax=Eumeta variegata TaxID=151549 RepID=A0A4C1V643_EUMVA|nr:hypothetical protein EVAR_17033_1 [Eumeta japonica]